MILEEHPFKTYMPMQVHAHITKYNTRSCADACCYANRTQTISRKCVLLCLVVTVVFIAMIVQSSDMQVGWRMGRDRMFDLSPMMQQSQTQVTVTVAEIERVQRQRARCNLLVFGVGFDTAFWMQMNSHGVTVFLEDNVEWLDSVQTKVPNATIYSVSYTTELGMDDEAYLEPSSWPQLQMGLPSVVLETEWDIVIVDGPAGYKNGDPGRIQSLYTAATLYRPFDALTVVDDCDRWLERTYADLFLGAHRLFLTVSRPMRFVWSRYNPIYGGNQQCFYRGVGLEEVM